MKRDSLKFSMLALPLFLLIAVIGLILPLPATMESERHNGARPAPTPPEPLPPQNSNRPDEPGQRPGPSCPELRECRDQENKTPTQLHVEFVKLIAGGSDFMSCVVREVP